MQLIISIVTPLDFSRQVEYSCVISLSAAATGGVLKKNAKPIAVTFVVHSRLFATSLLNFGIIVNLDNLISHLRTRHRRLRDRDRRPVAIACQPIAATYRGCAYQQSRPYDLITKSLSAGHDGRTNIPLLEPGCFIPQVQ